jgi:hypothetical protein
MFDDDAARINANAYQREHSPGQQGAGLVMMGYPCLVFAYDDYAHNPVSQRAVALLRQLLCLAGMPILGFGLSDDSRTWVMFVGTVWDEQVRQMLEESREQAMRELKG